MGPAAHQLHTFVLGDDPEAWAMLGFAVVAAPTDPGGTPDRGEHNDGSRVRLGNTTVVLTGEGGGFRGWAIDGQTGAIDGLSAVPPVDGDRGPPVDEDAGPPTARHPNGIISIDHVVVSTGDMDRTAAALEAAGLDCRGSRSTTRYGTPMRQCFYWLGDVILEVVGPDAGEPTTAAPPDVFGLALVSGDIDATVSYLRGDTQLGELAGNPRDAVQPGRRIASVRGDRVGVSLPLAVMSPHPGRGSEDVGR